MIVFDLKCGSGSHVFEAWFGSSEDYQDQKARGLVECPLCGSPDVDKAVMAPRVGAKANRVERPTDVAAGDDGMKAMLAAMAAVQKKMLKNSDFVGERFADEARAIHLGEAAARSIHGKATKAETESLLADGIHVAPLPFPVVAPGEEN